ncbi:choice-of-anchor P family protein [Paenarthrobacter nicotinovorans]|uniref:choice-of-anchor P family protein n=1 Tax=Paenarthrobacter nicotinovorans TaxID=29320 RepID=UPI0004ADB2EE|nr:choice-of-anchor P family protein [Paenarthrobacter nicotinovorans]
MKRSRVALIGALTLALAGPAAPALAATTPAQVSTGFSGTAYGSYIFNTDKTLTSGPTANSSINCTAVTGKTSSNTTAALTVPAVGNVGAATTSVKTVQTTTGKRIESKSAIASTSLLGGLITAGAITSESSADKNTAGAFSGSNKTTVTDLKVLGVTVGANPGANTVLDLNVPLVGSVGKITLNGQEKGLVNGVYQVSTTALRVEVLKTGLPGLKIGTDIRLGVSTASLPQAQSGYLSGVGFSTRALLASGLVNTGPTALAYAKCGGGTNNANTAGATIPGILTVGASSTATTGVLTPQPKVTVSDTVAGLNLLNGAIRADAIKAETSATRAAAASTVTLTDTSTFTNLKIAGLPAINASVAPNTVIQVAGLGQVTLHKVSKSSTSIIVVMIDVVLNQPLGALPTGARIQIGYSSTGITP